MTKVCFGFCCDFLLILTALSLVGGQSVYIGEIQEAIFEEKIFRIFFTQKKVFFLASQYKTGLYLDLLLENRI